MKTPKNGLQTLTGRLFYVAPLLLLLRADVAHASIFGEENATLMAMHATMIEQTGKFSQMVKQATDAVNIANETLGVAKDAYAGVQYFVNFDPSKLSQEAAKVARTFGIVNQGEGLYNQVENLTKQGINGGNFNITSPLNVYDKATGTWKKVQKLTNNDDDLALQLSETRQQAKQAATKRLEGEDAKGSVNIGDALRFTAGDTVDTNILDTESAIRKGSNEVAQQASDAMKDIAGAGTNTSKALYVTAQMTSLSAQQLALLNKQVAAMNSWKSIEEAQKQNAKEKADLVAVQSEQTFDEHIQKLINEKEEPNPQMTGWHDDIVGGF